MATETHPHIGDHPDWYDPFSQSNTFPSGWDLADVLALERERMETKDRVLAQWITDRLIHRMPCLNR